MFDTAESVRLSVRRELERNATVGLTEELQRLYANGCDLREPELCNADGSLDLSNQAIGNVAVPGATKILQVGWCKSLLEHCIDQKLVVLRQRLARDAEECRISADAIKLAAEDVAAHQRATAASTPRKLHTSVVAAIIWNLRAELGNLRRDVAGNELVVEHRALKVMEKARMRARDIDMHLPAVVEYYFEDTHCRYVRGQYLGRWATWFAGDSKPRGPAAC